MTDPDAEPGHPLRPPPASLPVAAVARQLGIAPATLRTWDRRYGLGPSEHTEGEHRRYGPRDVARLQHMRRLVLAGVTPAEAAAAARAAEGATAPAAAPHPAEGGAGDTGAAHGGRVLALPSATAAVRGLARAVLALDDDAVRRQLVAAVLAHGVTTTWESLLRPVLRAVGERWAATGEGVEAEHLLSGTAAAALREAVRPPPAVGQRPVLLAGSQDDLHSLPLHVVAAALAEQGVAGRVIGADLPAAALHAAVRRTGPAAVLVWAQFKETAAVTPLQALPLTRPPTRVFVGGPGWAAVALPARVRLLPDLATAVTELTSAVGLPWVEH